MKELKDKYKLLFLKFRRPCRNQSNYWLLMQLHYLPEFLLYKQPLQLPIVAKSLFIKDFALGNDSKTTQDYYYREQCAIKELYGVKSNIKFINN